VELLSLQLFDELGELVSVDLGTSLLKNFFDIGSRGLILSSENAESVGSKVFHITLDLLNNNLAFLFFSNSQIGPQFFSQKAENPLFPVKIRKTIPFPGSLGGKVQGEL